VDFHKILNVFSLIAAISLRPSAHPQKLIRLRADFHVILNVFSLITAISLRPSARPQKLIRLT